MPLGSAILFLPFRLDLVNEAELYRLKGALALRQFQVPGSKFQEEAKRWKLETYSLSSQASSPKSQALRKSWRRRA
jgi:hypothetical protein